MCSGKIERMFINIKKCVQEKFKINYKYLRMCSRKIEGMFINIKKCVPEKLKECS